MTAKPHDALFKVVFGTPANAAELFRSWLPEALTSAIVWQTIVSEPASFIDSELNDYHSDLLFSARTHDGQRVYLALEHQSCNHPWMPFRELGYSVQICDRHIRQFGGPFPLIIPVVVSHAPGGWTAPRNLHELIQPSPASFEGVSQLVPSFTMLVVDLAHLTNEDLKARELSAFPKLTLWALRDARDAHELLNNIQYWAKEFGELLESPSGHDAVRRILRYLALVCEELHYAQFRAKLREQLEHYAERSLFAETLAAVFADD